MRSEFILKFVGAAEATAAVAFMALRSDMAASLEAHNGVIPNGPKWLLHRAGKILAVGGLEPAGAGASLGWMLVSDLDRRDWAGARRAMRSAIVWARGKAIRRVHALVVSDRPGPASMLAGLGFKLTGQEGQEAVMTLELK